MKKIVFILLALLTVHTVLAQTVDCPSIVKAALKEVDQACADTGRNQLCYGNITLSATPRAGVNDLNFQKAGDHASVTDIQSLQLSSLNVSDNSWGIALMELQANLPNTLPGQNVKFLLFGDVQIENKSLPVVEIPMITTRNVNVRLRPNAASSNIIKSLKAGENVIATGRLADSSWVRVKVEGDSRSVGWVAVDYLKGDLSKLNVVKTDTSTWGPMQSFYFRSGIGDRPCAQAPDSGILIQTPKGSGKVTLNVNDVEIKLGSTIYLQAQPSGLMTVTVVEGQAVLQTGGQTQIVPAGTYSQVNLDANGQAAGSASFPKPYDAAPLQALPLSVTVFDPVQIAVPLTTTQIQTTLESLASAANPTSVVTTDNSNQSSGDLKGGQWYQTNVITKNTCDPTGTNAVGSQSRGMVDLTFSPGRESLVWGGWETHSLSRISDNSYQGVSDYDHLTITITFTSATTYNFLWSGIYTEFNGKPACDYIMNGNGVFQG